MVKRLKFWLSDTKLYRQRSHVLCNSHCVSKNPFKVMLVMDVGVKLDDGEKKKIVMQPCIPCSVSLVPFGGL